MLSSYRYVEYVNVLYRIFTSKSKIQIQEIRKQNVLKINARTLTICRRGPKQIENEE